MSSDHLYKLFFDKLLEKSEDGFVIIDENGIIIKALGKVKAAENPAQMFEALA